jgi:hypothetical protein
MNDFTENTNTNVSSHKTEVNNTYIISPKNNKFLDIPFNNKS